MVIPETVFQPMRDGEAAWNKLVAMAKGNKAKWTPDQESQLALIAELLKNHHNVLKRLIDANLPS